MYDITWCANSRKCKRKELDLMRDKGIEVF